jgi:hypothetical protein
MPDGRGDADLPIVDEIGDALYRAAVAEAAQRRRHARWRRRPASWSRRPLISLVALVGASATVGGIALAGGLGGGSPVTPDQFVAGKRPVAPAVVAPAQGATLAILRRGQVAADALPAAAASALTAGAGVGASGPSVALSRRAQGLSGGAAWVVPAAGQVCLIAEAGPALGGAGCAPDATAANGRLLVFGSSARTPGIVFVAGLVPDGVPAVSVELAGGTTVSAPVAENVYVASIHGAPSAVSFTGPAGAVTVSITLPQHHPHISGRGQVGP